MMWFLKKNNSETAKYLISEKQSYTVGRQNCDIILEGDLSVSRKHCTLHIAKQNECPFQVHTSTGVWLVDEQSNYGTFVRINKKWVKISPKQDYQLSHGDIIKFGMMENIWSVKYRPLIVCTSGIQSSQKTKIEHTLKSIDGELRNSWCKGCSLVVVNEVSLTVKVVLALILGIPIVTPNFVEKFVDSIRNQTDLPNYENFRPKIKETVLDVSLVSMDVKNNRKELFKGKTFLIPTKKQLEILKEVITAAGGKAELLSLKDSWLRFADENTILIQSSFNDSTIPDSLNKSLKDIATYLQSKHNKRMIPESEIAQAVAYSSIEKYCNPKSSCFSLRRVQMKQSHGDLLVEETPDIAEENIPDSCIIPNSATIHSQPEDIIEAHCSKIIDDGAVMSTLLERKRAHSPVCLDDYQNKKPRQNGKSLQTITNPDSECNVIKEKPTNKTEKNPRVNSSKSSDISNYFTKLGKTTKEIPQEKPDTSDFWNYENYTLKRKSSTKSNADEGSLRKKSKFSEENQLRREPEIDTPREVVEVEPAKTFSPVPAVRKIVEEEKDFSDYFGKDKDDIGVNNNDLDNTIFSLTIISPAYLKADGSLIEPPSMPVNVKKFRKQKVQSVVIDRLDDDLSDGEWIEPHPREVSVGNKHW